jgi:hypothetical protein
MMGNDRSPGELFNRIAGWMAEQNKGTQYTALTIQWKDGEYMAGLAVVEQAEADESDEEMGYWVKAQSLGIADTLVEALAIVVEEFRIS